MPKDKIQYVVALIAEFAKRYKMTDADAMHYLQQYNALDLCEKHYDYLHTQSFSSNVDDVSAYCKRMGGSL